MKPRSEYPSEQADKFLVRFPDGMRDRIAELAKANGRSMNAEIVMRLEQSLARGRGASVNVLEEDEPESLAGLLPYLKRLIAVLEPESVDAAFTPMLIKRVRDKADQERAKMPSRSEMNIKLKERRALAERETTSAPSTSTKRSLLESKALATLRPKKTEDPK